MIGFVRRNKRLILVGTLFLTSSITLGSIPTDDLINFVGSENAYILMFALGLAGGLTTFTGIPYHLVLMSLAAGGLNPLLLGISTAIGVMCGDSTMYAIGRQFKETLSPRLTLAVDEVRRLAEAHPRLLTPALILYGALSPFSNDFIVGSLSIAGHSYWRTIIPLSIGNLLYNIGIAYLGFYAYDTIIAWF